MRPDTDPFAQARKRVFARALGPHPGTTFKHPLCSSLFLRLRHQHLHASARFIVQDLLARAGGLEGGFACWGLGVFVR